MGRVWLTVVLPLLLPTILYVLWGWTARGKAGRPTIGQSWPWLVIAGVVLCGSVLVAAWLRAGGGGNGDYVPPHMLDGKVVPGRLIPPETPPR
ncbi:MAG TPA: DUF6111 family protein [Stellaceae bacterium]|nr:DUF6111 family protein [Stellaceae bacterium]